jgi:uncharacterized protein (DUF697 family)/vacuolar-type H+-ATPase subunit H
LKKPPGCIILEIISAWKIITEVLVKMGIKNAFSYLNLLRTTPKNIDKEVKKEFTVYLVGSPEFVTRFHDVLVRGMVLDVPAEQRHVEQLKYIKILPMPIDEEQKQTMKADAIICLLTRDDATRENLISYRELYKLTHKAHLFIEEPLTYTDKDIIYDRMDDLGITGREWIGTPSEIILRDKADVILGINDKISMAMAYRFPVLREEMSKKIIGGTSTQNLMVAVASSLPSNIPVVGIIIGLLAAAGETTVITINQMKMSLQLAAIHGMEMNLMERLKELWPLVGSAFGFRTVARTLVGLVPVAGAPIKGVIAYGGTAFVGDTVRWYYQTGHKMSSEERKDLYRKSLTQGIEKVRTFFGRLASKYPEAIKESRLDLSKIEDELNTLEKDMDKLEPSEIVSEERKAVLERNVQKISRKFVEMDESIERDRRHPVAAGGSQESSETGSGDKRDASEQQVKKNTIDEEVIKLEILASGKRDEWTKPGAAVKMPSPQSETDGIEEEKSEPCSGNIDKSKAGSLDLEKDKTVETDRVKAERERITTVHDGGRPVHSPDRTENASGKDRDFKYPKGKKHRR